MTSAFKGGDAKGIVEGATDALAGLAQTLDLVVPGLGQVAAGAIKAGGAFAAMTVGIVQGGVELATEVRATNAALEAIFDAFGKGPEAGARTVEMLDTVRGALPQTREQLAAWTREIEKMGVTDLGQVRQELLATASAQGILGEEGPAAYERIERKVQDAVQGHHKLTIASKELTKTIGTNLADAIAGKMGMSLEQLEVKLKAGTVDATKFGNAMEETFIEKGSRGLDAMWMRTGTITKKIKDSFGELFADVDTKPLTDAMRNLLALFDQTEPSGQAMKSNITTAFNGIVKAIGSAITEGEVWLLKTEVYALSMELALKPYIGALKTVAKLLGDITGLGGVLADASTLGATKAPGPASAVQLQTHAVQSTANALSAIGDPAGALLRGTEIGQNIASGLIAGMLAFTGNVDAAGRELGRIGVRGTKEGAGVHSPSRPAMEIGAFIPEGLAIGMESRTGRVGRAGREISGHALGGMVGQMLTSPVASQGAGAAGGISISGLTIQIMAPQGVTDAAGLSATGLTIALERLQLANGR